MLGGLDDRPAAAHVESQPRPCETPRGRVPHATLAVQPAPGMDHAAWVLGHLACTADMLGAMIGLQPVCPAGWLQNTPTRSRIIAESSGDTAVEENSEPLWVAPDLGDLVRLLADLPEGQRQALVSLMRHAAGGG